jgi:hypothetical protein
MNPAKKLSQADIIQRHTDNVVDAFPNQDLKALATDLEADLEADRWQSGAPIW